MQENLLRKKISKKKKNQVSKAEKQGEIQEKSSKSQPKNFLIEFEDDSENEEKPQKTEEKPQKTEEKPQKTDEKLKKTEEKLKKTEENSEKPPNKISKSILKKAEIPLEIIENLNIQPKSSRFNSLAICFPDSIIALHQVSLFNAKQRDFFIIKVFRITKLFYQRNSKNGHNIFCQ